MPQAHTNMCKKPINIEVYIIIISILIAFVRSKFWHCAKCTQMKITVYNYKPWLIWLFPYALQTGMLITTDYNFSTTTYGPSHDFTQEAYISIDPVKFGQVNKHINMWPVSLDEMLLLSIKNHEKMIRNKSISMSQIFMPQWSINQSL